MKYMSGFRIIVGENGTINNTAFSDSPLLNYSPVRAVVC